GDGFFTLGIPGDVAQVDHAVQLRRKANEQTELGDVLDLAFDDRTDAVLGDKRIPRIGLHLVDDERDAALFAVHVEHLHVDFLRGAQDLRRVQVLLGPAHFANVHQAFNARLEFNERAVVGDVGDAAGELAAGRVLGINAIPRIGHELL